MAAFGANDPPDRYPQLLERVREAAEMAVVWQNQRDGKAADQQGDEGEAGSREFRVHKSDQAVEAPSLVSSTV